MRKVSEPTGYGAAWKRWAGVGPYYAMFPSQFAHRVVREFSEEGDVTLDPFAGRGTAVFAAAVQGRIGLGVEINPVGWVYAQAKLNPAPRVNVEARIAAIGRLADRYRTPALRLPTFFQRAYRLPVRQFLLAARSHLDWRCSNVDRTLMAILLVHLHGKTGNALSNQMRQTKAMSPKYAVRWWSDRGSVAPRLDPVAYLLRRVSWRYAKGIPELRAGSRTYLGDSVRGLSFLGGHLPKRASLLFTSPPYCGVTDYHYDQWLRLWLLGGEPYARRTGRRYRGRFDSAVGYRDLLYAVFQRSARLLRADGTVYVRTGRDRATLDVTQSVLRETFPKHRLQRFLRPFNGPTQTVLFGDHNPKRGEVDLILTR